MSRTTDGTKIVREFVDGRKRFDVEICFDSWFDSGEDDDGNTGFPQEDWMVRWVHLRMPRANRPVPLKGLPQNLQLSIVEFAEQEVEDFIACGGTGND
jgi:hypothetical protein